MNWTQASPEERVAYLQRMENTRAIKEKRSPASIELRPMADHQRGRYSPSQNKIVLNHDMVAYGKIKSSLSTYYHEARHAYQNHVVKNPHQHPEVSIATREKWTKNMSHYKQYNQSRVSKIQARLLRDHQDWSAEQKQARRQEINQAVYRQYRNNPIEHDAVNQSAKSLQEWSKHHTIHGFKTIERSKAVPTNSLKTPSNMITRNYGERKSWELTPEERKRQQDFAVKLAKKYRETSNKQEGNEKRLGAIVRTRWNERASDDDRSPVSLIDKSLSNNRGKSGKADHGHLAENSGRTGGSKGSNHSGLTGAGHGGNSTGGTGSHGGIGSGGHGSGGHSGHGGHGGHSGNSGK